MPIRVELGALSTDDFERILTEPKASPQPSSTRRCWPPRRFTPLEFTRDGIRHVAEAAWQVNERTENIGARRLHTVMEKLTEEISFEAADHAGQSHIIDAEHVNKHLGKLVEDEDLSRYIL